MTLVYSTAIVLTRPLVYVEVYVEVVAKNNRMASSLGFMGSKGCRVFDASCSIFNVCIGSEEFGLSVLRICRLMLVGIYSK